MTDERDDLAELRRAFAAGSSVPPAPETCPSPEAIWAGVRGELPPAELRAVVDHLAGCSPCAEDWRLAAAVGLEPAGGRAVAEPEGETARERQPRWRAHRARWVVWGGAAAAAAALVVELLGPAPTPVVRGAHRAGDGTAVHAAESCVSREHCGVGWLSTPGATYDLTVTTVDGRPVATKIGLREARYTIPEDELATYPSSTVFAWTVEASLPQGGRTEYRGNFILP